MPTSAHPDTISRNTIGDRTHRKKWEIRLEVKDDTNHGQTYYLYNPENLDDGFSITNQKYEHELPNFTATLDRSSVDVSEESQDVILTLDWSDESGVNLEEFLDKMDENRNGDIQEEDESTGIRWFLKSGAGQDDAISTTDRNKFNSHELEPYDYAINNELTNSNRAVVDLYYRIPQGFAPGEYDAIIFDIMDNAHNGWSGRVYNILEVQSDTEINPPVYEIISISDTEVDVTNNPVDITVRFRITDESGIEERNTEGSSRYLSPGFWRNNHEEGYIRSTLRRNLCQDTLYLDAETSRAEWDFTPIGVGDIDGDFIGERFFGSEFDSGLGQSSEVRIEGDNKDGVYETTITIDQMAYPGLYRLELVLVTWMTYMVQDVKALKMIIVMTMIVVLLETISSRIMSE